MSKLCRVQSTSKEYLETSARILPSSTYFLFLLLIVVALFNSSSCKRLTKDNLSSAHFIAINGEHVICAHGVIDVIPNWSICNKRFYVIETVLLGSGLIVKSFDEDIIHLTEILLDTSLNIKRTVPFIDSILSYGIEYSTLPMSDFKVESSGCDSLFFDESLSEIFFYLNDSMVLSSNINWVQWMAGTGYLNGDHVAMTAIVYDFVEMEIFYIELLDQDIYTRLMNQIYISISEK